MENEVRTVADYLRLSRGMSEGEFLTTFSYPVLIEKLGVFPHEHPSLLAGTVLADEQPNLSELVDESDDQDIRNARVFILEKKPGSMGPDIFIGRAPTNDIVLPSSSVSKSHAQVTPDEDAGQYQLADMFSSNGTSLNNQKIHPFEKHQLNDRDQVRLGPDYLLIYYSPSTFYELLISLRI